MATDLRQRAASLGLNLTVEEYDEDPEFVKVTWVGIDDASRPDAVTRATYAVRASELMRILNELHFDKAQPAERTDRGEVTDRHSFLTGHVIGAIVDLATGDYRNKYVSGDAWELDD